MCGTLLNSKTLTTRKPHQCVGCGCRYPAKTVMRRVVTVDGGDFDCSYWCAPCDAFFESDRDGGDDCITLGQFAGDKWYYEFLAEWRGKNLDYPMPIERAA